MIKLKLIINLVFTVGWLLDQGPRLCTQLQRVIKSHDGPQQAVLAPSQVVLPELRIKLLDDKLNVSVTIGGVEELL